MAKIALQLEQDGREWLSNRCLDPDVAQTMGIGQAGDHIAFNYESGKIQRIKYRNMQDKKDQSFGGKAPEEWVIPLFNQKDFKDKSYIIITEGELDTVAVFQLGYTNVVSLPNGATSAEKTIKNHFKYLCEFETVYIFLILMSPDNKQLRRLKKYCPNSNGVT